MLGHKNIVFFPAKKICGCAKNDIVHRFSRDPFNRKGSRSKYPKTTIPFVKVASPTTISH